MTDDLEQLEAWVGAMIARYSPIERRKLAARIGTLVRRSNMARIKDQKNPDGSAYAPRKRAKKQAIRSRFRRIKKRAEAAKSGPMFRKLRQSKYLRMEATSSEASVGFSNPTAARIARVHQEGLQDAVSRQPGAPRVAYARRILLGFTEEDRRSILDLVLEQVSPAP